MEQEKERRTVNDYEITQGIRIGEKEVVFGIDEKNEMPYFCGFYTSNELFESYQDCVIGNDYVEIVDLFAQRVKEQCVKVREEQESVTVPREKITKEMCLPLKSSVDLSGKVAVIKPEVLRPEYRSSENQLVLVTGGYGAHGNARGRACFCTTLYSGNSHRWNRQDILGEIKPECMPQWANERLEEIQRTDEQGRKERQGLEETKEGGKGGKTDKEGRKEKVR